MVRKISLSVPGDQIWADLERYVALAREWGCAEAAVVRAEDVKVDLRVQEKCRIPRCFHFGSCANCPPFTPDAEQFRKRVLCYQYAVVMRHDVEPVSDFADRKQSLKRSKEHERKLARAVAEVEIAAFSDGYYLALGLACGSCRSYLCDDQVCQYLDSGRCRFPRVSRPSMEAMGIDVYHLAAFLGWEVYPIGPEKVESSMIPRALAMGIVFIV